MLIVPEASVTEVMLGNGYQLSHFRSLLERLEVGYKARERDPQMRKWIVQMHTNVQRDGHQQKNEMLGWIAVVAITLADPSLFREAADSGVQEFSKEVSQALGE